VTERQQRSDDVAARLLELGLMGVLLFGPWPLGAVGPRGRLALESAALALGLVWVLRSVFTPPALPPRTVRVGIAGLLVLAAIQTLPLGEAPVAMLSPRSMVIRAASVPSGEALAAEARIIGRDPVSLDAAPALSVDPSATASALRTGAALAVLLLVGVTVAATRGASRLAGALLVSASFQGLYGLLVLASGHDKIWFYDKIYYLNSATGTYVNRNHFASFLAMALACGLALILRRAKRARFEAAPNRLVALFSGEGSRILLLGLLLIVGLAGLLASLSRAGTALGLLALLVTFAATRRLGGQGTRVVVALLIVAAAAVPLVQLGSDRLLSRYAEATSDFTAPGNRATVWADTATLAVSFPVVGSGFGTFAQVYPVFRSPEVRAFYAHAHNDLLQAWAEGGTVGLVLLALILIPLLVEIVRATSGSKGTLAIGIAAALTAFLLHGLVDFNTHIPANAATAAILAGTLFGLPCKSAD